MFPACAGMNRPLQGGVYPFGCVPRMRGDEPRVRNPLTVWLDVFPACAGMNRWSGCGMSDDKCVPRMRGDEPAVLEETSDDSGCSPHARG